MTSEAGAVAAAEKYTGFAINVSNVQAGTKVLITVGANSPGDAHVGWSSGRSFATAAGMQLFSSTGTLPLAQLNITSSSLTFVTASGGGGGGGALSFSFQLYLAGSADVASFAVTVLTDPNVLVTGALSGALPQTIGTATIFNWPS